MRTTKTTKAAMMMVAEMTAVAGVATPAAKACKGPNCNAFEPAPEPTPMCKNRNCAEEPGADVFPVCVADEFEDLAVADEKQADEGVFEACADRGCADEPAPEPIPLCGSKDRAVEPPEPECLCHGRNCNAFEPAETERLCRDPNCGAVSEPPDDDVFEACEGRQCDAVEVERPEPMCSSKDNCADVPVDIDPTADESDNAAFLVGPNPKPIELCSGPNCN